MKKKRILIVAGGTGGHIFPALAVARALRNEGWEPYWLGSQVGMESSLVGNEFPISCLSIKALRGKRVLSKLMLPGNLTLATWQAWRIVKKVQPDMVLGMGGFVSGPGGIAARLARVPLVIHEQNAIAGMTNRLLSKYAQVVLQGFPNAFPSSVVAKTIGNPIRPAISALATPQERFKNRNGPLRILVIGGSQGARAINQVMMRFLGHYHNDKKLMIRHQTGHLDFDEVQRAYRQITVPVTVEAFIDDMTEAYCWADLIICRAGALTVSEIAAVGVPSILIPFPYAVDDHQFLNGSYLARAGAAELIRQENFTEERLRQLFESYLSNRTRLVEMAEKARSLGKPEALSAIVTLCQQIIKQAT